MHIFGIIALVSWPSRDFGGCNGSILKFYSSCQGDVFGNFCQNDDTCFGYVTNLEMNNTIGCATFTAVARPDQNVSLGTCYTKQRGKFVKNMPAKINQICINHLETDYNH